jgi:hypothetical protein
MFLYLSLFTYFSLFLSFHSLSLRFSTYLFHKPYISLSSSVFLSLLSNITLSGSKFLKPSLLSKLRGYIQCLKLSPNLRKLTKEVKAATLNKDPKKILSFETKKLEVLLAMVKEPEEGAHDEHDKFTLTVL